MPYKDIEKQRAAWRAYYHRYPNRQQEFKSLKRKQTSEWFNEFKAGFSCIICGESEPACIDFHHLQGDEKIVNVADLLRNRVSKERIIAEIGKCVALCANCHRKLH